MKSLVYLFLVRLKNQIKGFFKSPAKLIFLIFVLAMLILVVFSGNSVGAYEGEFRDISELYAIIFALYNFVFITISYGGFSKGASLFSMADVNFLFPSPISSVAILFYGLIQQIGTSLFLGIFILYQYSWLHGLYGINIGFLILILIGYAITLFCGQLTAMVIYSITSSNEQKIRNGKIIFLANFGTMALYLLSTLLVNEENILEALIATVNGYIFSMVPVGGWVRALIIALTTGEAVSFIVTFVVLAVFIGLMVLILIKQKSDYYEDVLKATEITFSAITSRKEGKIGEVSPQNVKVGRIGINKGFGANAIYYKHKVENRRAKKLILDIPTISMLAVVIIFAFFTRKVGISAIFSFSTYMQMFSIAMGRWAKELIMPYIYMIPEPPFKKLINGIRGEFPRLFIEALVLFIPISFILKLSPIETILCILARVSFGLLFIAGNFLVDRLFGTTDSKGLILIFYFLAIIVMALPGIILAIVLSSIGVIIFSFDATILLSLTLLNILVSIIAFYFCRDVLQYAELNKR